MNYLIFNEDGERPGEITQSNKVFDPSGYDEVLKDAGHKFIAIENVSYLNPAKFIVKDGAPVERPAMPVVVDKTTIKAGGNEAAVFTGVPKNAQASCTTSGLDIGGAIIPDGEFELPIPVPCVYRVTITLWPYLDFVCDITAVP